MNTTGIDRAGSALTGTDPTGIGGPAGVDPAHIDAQLLDHHGDVEARGMLDLAVNVAVTEPPAFVRDAVLAAATGLAAYPDPSATTVRLSEHLGVARERVLLTNGAAEAFHLVARAAPWRDAVVVHPQFTEPDTALAAAGIRPAHHVLAAPGFAFDAAEFEQDHPTADLVVVGNPTNPTSRLHPAADLLRLRRPGRLLMVDEAFMDVVPREQDTLLRHAAAGEGVVVIRSLTKTFGLAGLRAGFLVGDPAWIAACARQQPHWSVNHLALAAVSACCSEQGVVHVEAVAAQIAAHRPHLVGTLESLGFDVVSPPAAPFVLARHPQAAHLRTALREVGIAVRRGDTFPGLGLEWIRVAVRPPEVVDTLAHALRPLTTRTAAADRTIPTADRTISEER